MRGSAQIPDDIHIPQSAIPQPTGLIIALHKSMGLDRTTVRIFASELRLIAEKCLNTDRSWNSQDEAQRDKCIDKACKRFPFVLRYQYAWPIKQYLRQWLATKAWRIRMRASQAPERELGHADASLRSSEVPPRRVAKTHDPTHSNGTRSSTQRDLVEMEHSMIIVVDSDDEEASARRSVRNVRSVASERAHLQRTAEPSESVVRQFLRSAYPTLDLEVSAPRFFEAGVHSEAWLRELASMPEADLYEFLERSVGLNPLQSALVKVALKKYTV